MFDPDLVIIGGGFGAAAGDLVLEPARGVGASRGDPAGGRDGCGSSRPSSGDEAGLIGAALVGFEALDGER